MKKMKRVSVGLMLTLFVSSTAMAKVNETADSVAWHTLMHYRPSIIGVKSTIDSNNFFLADDGKTDPHAELTATIALFESDDIQRQCLFPARYQFLKKQKLIQKEFPACPEYEQFVHDLNPAGLTLLYTDAYMNNPSSLFGHTLMRIDIPEGRTQLVAHGVNYGAFVDPNENGLLFAVYGLTGGYMGGFTVKPYYNIINTYNNIENRDIWELTLNLTPDELSYFVAHLWEVGHTQTRYFFFTENCSYMLMEMLDATRPSLNLADDFPVQAIPLDTLKAVQKRPGLVKEVNYRPSRQQRILNRYNALSAEQRSALKNWLNGRENYLDDLDELQQAQVLDVAYEYTQYQWEAQDIKLSDYRKRSFDVLRKRRGIEMKTDDQLKQKPSPLSAHESARIGVSYGWRSGQPFQEVAIRPAYHSLTDRTDGLLPGAEINFLNTRLRHYNHHNRTVFQGIDLVEITSVSPWNMLFKPISYNIKTSVNREINLTTNQEGYVYNLKGGAGAATRLGSRIMAFGYMNTAFKYGGFMPHNQALGIGPQVGILTHLGPVQFLGTAEYTLSDNDFMRQSEIKAEVTYSVMKNVALAAEYAWLSMKHKTQNEIKMGIRFYF